MRFVYLGIVTALIAIFLIHEQHAASHVFWLTLNDYHLDEVGPETRASVGWGHRLPVDEKMDASRLGHYDHVTPEGKRLALTPSGDGFLEAAITVQSAGGHIVLASRAPGFFTVWEEDGETKYGSIPMTGLDNVSSSTFNEMYGKALLTVESVNAADFSEPVGDSLEIIPLVNPRTLSIPSEDSSSPLSVRVLFRGEAIANAEISATYIGYSMGMDYVQSTTTNQEGLAVFDITTPGVWILHAFVSTDVRAEFAGKAQEEHYHATLTFEAPAPGKE